MVNRNNYKYTREFLDFLREIKQLRSGSVRRYKAYLNHFLLWLDDVPIRECESKRPSFPSYLARTRNDGKVEPLVPKTQKKVIQTIKRFLSWLIICYPRKFSSPSLVWIESLQTTPNIERPKEHIFVTPDEAIQLSSYPLGKELVYQRDQAATAMLFLSGMRASAFASLPIKAVDLENLTIKQWPSLGVRTKNRKHATTFLLDIPELIEVAERWDARIREELSANAMWYTPLAGKWHKRFLSEDPPGKNRHISLARRIRKLSKLVDVEYKSPHKFRHGHAVYALLRAHTMADYKAISQNLMHENIKVTDSVYAWLNEDDIKKRIAGLERGRNSHTQPGQELEAFLSKLSRSDIKEAIVHAANLLVN